jgi:hypothetical protein
MLSSYDHDYYMSHHPTQHVKDAFYALRMPLINVCLIILVRWVNMIVEDIMIQHLVQTSTTFIPSPSYDERIKDV